MNESVWKILRVLNLDNHSAAIKAVYFQIPVQLGITKSSNFVGKTFPGRDIGGLHLVVVC